MLKQNKTKNIFIFGAVIGLLIFLHLIKVLNPLENAILKIFEPFSSRAYKFSTDIKTGINEQMSKKDYIALSKSLQQQVERLTIESSKVRLLEEENIKLRGYMRFLTQNKYKYVMANIISQGTGDSLEAQKGKIIINRGSKDGLIAGLSVVDSEGIMIGKVMRTEDNTSEISLITNNDCKIAAFIQKSATSTTASSGENPNVIQGNTNGIIQGELGLTAKMDYIPQNEILNEGDLVITSGLEKDIPRGLVVGKILKVNKNNNEVWQNADIEPITDFENLSIVSILLP